MLAINGLIVLFMYCVNCINCKFSISFHAERRKSYNNMVINTFSTNGTFILLQLCEISGKNTVITLKVWTPSFLTMFAQNLKEEKTRACWMANSEDLDQSVL